MHVKYLKKTPITLQYYIITKVHNLQKNNTCDQNKKCKVFV